MLRKDKESFSLNQLWVVQDRLLGSDVTSDSASHAPVHRCGQTVWRSFVEAEVGRLGDRMRQNRRLTRRAALGTQG
jgi:hypothetical protein